jgi:hypothetical protein
MTNTSQPLLEALKDCIGFIEHLEDAHGIGDWSGLANAKAALSQHEGEQGEVSKTVILISADNELMVCRSNSDGSNEYFVIPDLPTDYYYCKIDKKPGVYNSEHATDKTLEQIIDSFNGTGGKPITNTLTSKLKPTPSKEQEPGEEERFAAWLEKNGWQQINEDCYGHAYKTWGGFPVSKQTTTLLAEFKSLPSKGEGNSFDPEKANEAELILFGQYLRCNGGIINHTRTIKELLDKFLKDPVIRYDTKISDNDTMANQKYNSENSESAGNKSPEQAKSEINDGLGVPNFDNQFNNGTTKAGIASFDEQGKPIQIDTIKYDSELMESFNESCQKSSELLYYIELIRENADNEAYIKSTCDRMISKYRLQNIQSYPIISNNDTIPILAKKLLDKLWDTTNWSIEAQELCLAIESNAANNDPIQRKGESEQQMKEEIPNIFLEKKQREFIICAAIHYDDGQVHPHQPVNVKTGIISAGRRHHNCFTLLNDAFGRKITQGHLMQGFLTSEDRFVQRKEAATIAFNSKQISSDNECLFSEDLY